MTQAVVANPRKNSSSPIGARMAPAIRFSTRPAGSRAGGSGESGVTPNADTSTSEIRPVTKMIGSAQAAPKASSPNAATEGGRIRISDQLSAPVSTTTRRIRRT